MESAIVRNRISASQYKASNVLQYIFLLYLLLKPYYVGESGGMQFSDVFLVLCFLYYLFSNSGKKLLVCPTDKILLIFVGAVALINITYYFIYLQQEFLRSTLHYIFNLMFIMIARVLVLDRGFLKKLFWVCRINLFLQLIYYVIGVGSYYADDADGRYLGTFNDPNQLAFFCFALVMIMFMLSQFDSLDLKVTVFDYAIMVYMIYLASSSGMFLAISIFFSLYIFISLFARKVSREKRKKAVHSIFIVLILVALGIVFFGAFSEFIFESDLYKRIIAKFDKYGSETGMSVWEERNIDKIYKAPIYNLFGAGQGYYSRFGNKMRSSGEIHSTWLSILFCYGVGPLAIMLAWMKKNIEKTTVFFIPVFLAIFIEGFTLLHQRQPFFWLFFVLAYAYKILESDRNENAICP